MIHWTWTGAAAGGAFILSFIIGLFSEVTPGMLFLRALGSGLFFALLITVIQAVVGKFLPELMEPLEAPEAESGDAQGEQTSQGERINIVLGEEGEEELPPLEVQDSGPPEFEEQGLDSLTSEGEAGDLPGEEIPVISSESAETGGLQDIPSLTADSSSEAIPDISALEGQFSGMSSVDGTSSAGGSPRPRRKFWGVCTIQKRWPRRCIQY